MAHVGEKKLDEDTVSSSSNDVIYFHLFILQQLLISVQATYQRSLISPVLCIYTGRAD